MATDDDLDKLKAEIIWNNMTANEKAAVRFGMFPAGKLRLAQEEGFEAHKLCIELMACAKNDGGMIA